MVVYEMRVVIDIYDIEYELMENHYNVIYKHPLDECDISDSLFGPMVENHSYNEFNIEEDTYRDNEIENITAAMLRDQFPGAKSVIIYVHW